jgi:malonyl-CoA/methylmalonyl-CoA synthetase
VGFPLPSIKIRVVDQETGNQSEENEVGMIEVKGPNVFKGYWQMPEKTAEEFQSDGYFITGDLGITDSDGYISIVGREKDLIITGGLNVYPKDVELVINQCKGVIESAVIGISDPDYGEKVVAVIVRDEQKTIGNNDSSIDTVLKENLSNEINLALTDNLAKYKHPKQLIYVKDLPRNTMGKVQKNTLRENYSLK